MSKSGISSFRTLTATLVAIILFAATATAQLLLGAGDGRKPAGGGGGNDCSGAGTIADDTNWTSGGGGNWAWDTGAGTGTQTFAATSIAGSNRAIVVGIITYQGETVLSVKWNTTEAFTHYKSQAGSVEGNTQNTELWAIANPTSGSHVITVVFNSAPAFATGVANSYTGVNQTAPIFSSAGTVSNVAATSMSLGTAATGGNNCWLVGLTFTRVTGGASAGAGTTLRASQGDNESSFDSGGTVTAGTPALAWTGAAGTLWPGVIVAALAPTP